MSLLFFEPAKPVCTVRLARIAGRWHAAFGGRFDAISMELPYSGKVSSEVIVAYLQRLNPEYQIVADGPEME